MGSEAGRRDVIADVGTLADPVRRRLYEHVAAQHGPVRRDAAAAAVGVSRTLAAYHLDRLAESGLLTTGYARPAGRDGPGAGRPAKHYQRVPDEISLSLPPRNYPLLARLLLDALAADDSGRVRAALVDFAEQQGRAAAQEGMGLVATLARDGYEPSVDDQDERIELRNCPFHGLARRQPDLVCSLNHALVRGLLAGRGEDPGCARLAPGAGRCCVTIDPPATPCPRSPDRAP